MQYNLSYLPKKEQKVYEPWLKFSFFSSQKLIVKEYENAYVLPSKKDRFGSGGVCFDNTLLEETTLLRSIYSEAERKNFFVETDKTLHDDREVVFLGTFSETWGHCITDNLKHLWFTLYDEYDFLKQKTFVYVDLTNDKKQLPSTFFEMLEKLGIKRDKMQKITTPTQFAKVYVPGQCFSGCIYTTEYRMLIDKITKDVKPVHGLNKIYLTRTLFKNRRDYGERRIENLFRKNGYTIVSLEKLSLDEQIALLKSASTIAGTEGSIMHNSVFMHKNSELILLRKMNCINLWQLALNQFIDARVTYIDAHLSCLVKKGYEVEGPFFLYASKALCKFLDEKKQIFPLFSFISYIIIGFVEQKIHRIIEKLYIFAEPIFGKQVRTIKKLLAKKN